MSDGGLTDNQNKSELFSERPTIFHAFRSTVTSETRNAACDCRRNAPDWERTMNPIRPAVSMSFICMSFASPLGLGATPAVSDNTDHQCGGEPCEAVLRGLVAFFDRELQGLEGNGRSCNDCHMLTEQFRLTPAAAEARYQNLQKRRRYNRKADDPLFRPIDADDFRIKGEQANDYSNLRQNGLVRVVFSLPPNMRLIDPVTNQPSGETTVDVWRMVPA